MCAASPPVVVRPSRQGMIRVETNANAGSPNQDYTSPLANFHLAFSKSLSKESPNPNALQPRAPLVHFFVCDHGNAKVKSFSDNFIELLISNGIKVYPELYLTHQPGYKVRAASCITTADFFFQIHSKTAGPGHVRLYYDGQPQRMTIQEAVTHIWSTWRMKCGALTKDEVDSLSHE